jgi:GNAT superfamily N-acetyltransferase
MTVRHACDECGADIEGDEVAAFGDAYIDHVRAVHPEWPYPDVAIRNYAEATQRLAPVRERLAGIGNVAIHPVTEDRIVDWLSFFDRDAFAGNPAWAGCYCAEPHEHPKGAPADAVAPAPWEEKREMMRGYLRSGKSFGYLAYVDGHPAGWVNASLRSNYALYREGDGADPADADVVGVSCFVIAPPYRRHGLAARLLDRVLEDAPGRDVAWVEAYPFSPARPDDAGNFRGPRSLYEERGFVEVEQRARDVVMRRPV